MEPVSEEPAQGQRASGRRPLEWNVDANWSQEDSDQGLAPSATKIDFKDDKLMSLWSLVANRPQCKSRDLTRANFAEKNDSFYFYNRLLKKWTKTIFNKFFASKSKWYKK